MRSLTIALLQILPGKTIDDNLRIGQDACRRAKASGADIALFPEMWSCGYAIPEDPGALRSLAVPADGAFASAFGRLAAELDMAVGIALLERFDPLPRNTLVLFDRHGRRAFTYAKVHTCDFGDERRLTPGNGFPVARLDTAAGPVQAGAMICYDREFPESARVLMLKGAELILVPNACPMELNRLAQLRARAFENMTAVATCNYPAGHPDCNGGSSVFDGVAYLPGSADPRDTCIFQAGGEEGVFAVRLDLDLLREYRRTEVHGNAYRRPSQYRLLTGEDVRPPFVRPDARR